MSALFHTPLSAPAERAEPALELTSMRFSRSLDERSPHTRSSTAQIVPMGADKPMHPADVLVIKWSAICCAFLVLIFTLELFA